MKALTFGWDFPPSRNGGLGVACFGLTRELTKEGIDVIFVLPRQQPVTGTPRFVFADLAKRVKLKPVDSALKPYQGSDSLVYYQDGFDDSGKPIIKCRTIMEEVHRFAHQASLVAQAEDFDIIHAHDWSSYLAGMAAKVASGKPLILHVHATSFDQAASSNVDPAIFQIEKEGFSMADKVVTVSGYTRDLIIENHGVDPSKVEVVHNGCEQGECKQFEPGLSGLKAQGYKIVLYHGRITIQKGVDYFVRAARKVIDIEPKTVFVISGWGDMTNQIIEEVGQLGLSKHFIFAGSLWEDDRDRMYQTADLVVMPSVSEPFGLVPLEALQQGTASLISKQSGVAEVLKHVLKVDFWDVDEMANQILSALRYPAMRRQMVNEGRYQLSDISWSNAAKKIKSLYRSLLQYVTT